MPREVESQSESKEQAQHLPDGWKQVEKAARRTVVAERKCKKNKPLGASRIASSRYGEYFIFPNGFTTKNASLKDIIFFMTFQA